MEENVKIEDRCRGMLQPYEKLRGTNLITSAEDAQGFVLRPDFIRKHGMIKPVASVILKRMDLVDPVNLEFREVQVRSVDLYDLLPYGAVQVITIGNDVSCDMRPFMEPLHKAGDGRTLAECLKDLHTDRVPRDLEVSPLHALMYSKDKRIYYVDRSALGSCINDEKSIAGQRFIWNNFIEDYVGIGQRRVIRRKEFPNAMPDKTRLVDEGKKSQFRIYWIPEEFVIKKK